MGPERHQLVEADRCTRAAALYPTLRLENVKSEYPKRGKLPAFLAVKDATLEIYPGEVVSPVGESGAEKTTIGSAAVCNFVCVT